MFWKASTLGEFRLEATDGPIGGLRDALFDAGWVVRWFVLDTGTWFPGRKVLIAPDRIDPSGTEKLELGLRISREQVRASPPLADEEAVSREHEERLAEHYGWQPYWTGVAGERIEPGGGWHLRSAREMIDDHIHARDGVIGHVDDLLIDPAGWAVRYLVVDTGKWLPGRLMLIVPQAVAEVDRAQSTVTLELTREQIRGGPAYDPEQTVDRAYEELYHGYYGYPTYW